MQRGGGLARAALLATVLPGLLALGGCSPAGSGAPGSASSVATSASQGPTPPPSLPTQTDTDWGRIWDAVPSSFPVIPGAVAATDTGEGAVSALLAVDAPDTMAVAGFYLDALQGMGLIASMDGPLEDGSITVSGSDGYGCAVRVTVKPVGSTYLISVLYGAGCPF